MKTNVKMSNRARVRAKAKARRLQFPKSPRDIEEKIHQLFAAKRKLATELWRKSRYGKPLKKDYCEVEWI